MANVVLQCSDSQEFCDKTANLINRLKAVKEQKSNFNAAIMDAGSGKIGAANERMLVDIVEVGGSQIDKALDSIIEVVGGNILESAFGSFYSEYGYHHSCDPRQD